MARGACGRRRGMAQAGGVGRRRAAVRGTRRCNAPAVAANERARGMRTALEDARRERRHGQFEHGSAWLARDVCVDASTISANDYVKLSINHN